MAISTEAPNPDSYNFVVQLERDVSFEQSQLFSSYEEVTTSRAINLNGRRKHMLFLRTSGACLRAQKLGWMDVTAEWMAWVDCNTARPTTDGQRMILSALAALGDGFHAKKAVVANGGIPDSEWRTAIQYLEKKGLVECSVPLRNRSKASNRSFKYQITPTGSTCLAA